MLLYYISGEVGTTNLIVHRDYCSFAIAETIVDHCSNAIVVFQNVFTEIKRL